MSLEACAEKVRKGDPDRFLATMAAPVALRPAYFALFAFNLEVARAAWVSQEPLVCEIRLQWWQDCLAAIVQGEAVAHHDILTPLADVLDRESAAILAEIIEARRTDIWNDGIKNTRDLTQYLETTAGGLMWVAARLAGASTGEAAVRDLGYGAGLANWFRAVPDLMARGRDPLPDLGHDEIATLAHEALERIKAARKAVPRIAYPATRTGWQADRALRSAAANPAAVEGGRLHNSEFNRKLTLLWRVLSAAP